MVSATQPTNGTKLNGRHPAATGRNRRQAPQVEQSTLRDQFAAAALQGILANPNHGKDGVVPARFAAEYAYDYADAMIAERDKAKSTR